MYDCTSFDTSELQSPRNVAMGPSSSLKPQYCGVCRLAERDLPDCDVQ